MLKSQEGQGFYQNIFKNCLFFQLGQAILYVGQPVFSKNPALIIGCLEKLATVVFLHEIEKFIIPSIDAGSFRPCYSRFPSIRLFPEKFVGLG